MMMMSVWVRTMHIRLLTINEIRMMPLRNLMILLVVTEKQTDGRTVNGGYGDAMNASNNLFKTKMLSKDGVPKAIKERKNKTLLLSQKTSFLLFL